MEVRFTGLKMFVTSLGTLGYFLKNLAGIYM